MDNWFIYYFDRVENTQPTAEQKHRPQISIWSTPGIYYAECTLQLHGRRTLLKLELFPIKQNPTNSRQCVWYAVVL